MVPVLAQFGVLSLYPCLSMSINGYENVSSKPRKILDREGYLGWTGDSISEISITPNRFMPWKPG